MRAYAAEDSAAISERIRDLARQRNAVLNGKTYGPARDHCAHCPLDASASCQLSCSAELAKIER